MAIPAAQLVIYIIAAAAAGVLAAIAPARRTARTSIQHAIATD